MQSETKTCQNCKGSFVIEPDDFGFYEKIKVPPPTFCPECRAIRRMIWRNERTLYHNTCAFTCKTLLSMFAPETGLTVYDRDVWWSDKWDPLSYGVDYDFSKPFFQQYKELLRRVPLANLADNNLINSFYCNHNSDLRNCYLVFASYMGENVSYANGAVEVKDSFDLYKVLESESCYEDILCANLFNTHFSFDSDESINSMFLTDCINLQDCLGCINLRHKRYCILNRQYLKKEYEEERAKYDFGSYKTLENFKREYNDFVKNKFRRFAAILKSKNVTGDFIGHSKNCRGVFDVYDGYEDCKYTIHGKELKNSYDGYGFGIGEQMYEGVDGGMQGANNFFSVINYTCLYTHYTYMCYGSKSLFGCIGVRNHDYAILNKKYTKEEYNKLMPKIIEHMNTMPYVDAKERVYKYGEFFPPEISPFAYNETIANEYYPKSKSEAGSFGSRWKGGKERDYKVEIKTEDLPDHIKDTPDDIVGKVIECAHKGECAQQCTEAFKILPQELQFLKSKNIALPRLCPNCRHFERLKKRNPFRLWHRQCMCNISKHEHGGTCPNEFETSYAPERPEIIYCEKCYQAEVY